MDLLIYLRQSCDTLDKEIAMITSKFGKPDAVYDPLNVRDELVMQYDGVMPGVPTTIMDWVLDDVVLESIDRLEIRR
jgi:hypothetical protein